jgi:hypothetical protein
MSGSLACVRETAAARGRPNTIDTGGDSFLTSGDFSG